MGNNNGVPAKSGVHLQSEKEAIALVQRIRLAEQERQDTKARNRQMRVRKHLLENLERELVEAIVDPCKEWAEDVVANLVLENLDACMNPSRHIDQNQGQPAKSALVQRRK